MKKKLLALVGVVYFGFCFMLLLGVNANAYIDPSVITYVIQAVAGITIAAGAAIGIYWRRAKKKIDKKLGIDENRNKEVESDEFLVKDDPEWKGEK